MSHSSALNILGSAIFKLKEILALPAAYTKGANALKRYKSTYQRRRISFSVHDFHQLVQRIETMAKASAEIKPEDFYLISKKHRGNSRDLPRNDVALKTAIENRLASHLGEFQSTVVIISKRLECALICAANRLKLSALVIAPDTDSCPAPSSSTHITTPANQRFTL